MSYSGAQITRLGLAAIPRALYGSFAGKATASNQYSLSAGHTLTIRGDDRRLSIHPDERSLAIRADGRKVTVH